MSAYARYEHTDFNSTDAGSDFVEDELKSRAEVQAVRRFG